MAWNGSDNSANTSRKTSAAPRRSSPLRGLVAGLIVILGAAVAAWYFLGRAGAPSHAAPAKKSGKIATVQHVTVTNRVAKAEEKPVEKEDRNSLEWLKKHDKRYFIPPDAVRGPYGRLYTKNGIRILEDLPARTWYANGGKKPIFEHPSERAIARILSIEPGKVFVGNYTYNQHFVEDFKASLTSPTLILKDDDEDTKALKQQVTEVKAELKERLDAGEDIIQIMKDAEKELRSLAVYRQNMQKELTALRFDENVSEQDYEDYVAAANKMLQERGMKGISSPKFAEGQLKYLRERHRILQQAKAEREAAAAAKAQK